MSCTRATVGPVVPTSWPNAACCTTGLRATVLALAATALLAGCSGDGGDGANTSAAVASEAAAAATRQRPLAAALNPSTWVAVTQPADALLQNLTIPADAPSRGMWSPASAWPMVGLHQAVLPNGKVLTWGTTPDGGSHNGRYFDVWDPDRGLAGSGNHQLTFDQSRQDSFCAPATFTGDGRLMITGGNGNGVTNQFYAAASNSFALGANAADQRWYATMVTLADGRAIVLGGMNPYTEGQYNDVAGALARGESSMTPEVLENGAWRSLFGAQSRTAFGPDFLRSSLPKVWAAPDGRVFGISTRPDVLRGPQCRRRQRLHHDCGHLQNPCHRLRRRTTRRSM